MGETTDLPLAVDLDGTLILTDMSRVTIVRVVLPRPWLIPSLIWWELTGQRAKWKRSLGKRLRFEPAELVYHEEFLAWLKEQKATGREIIMCTASERCVAEKISEYIGLFEDVMASDGITNLRRDTKGEALAARYGKGGFAYAGNSYHDLGTWPFAGEIIVVNASKRTLKALGDQPSLVFD